MADLNLSLNIKLNKEAVWDERQYKPNWAGTNGILGFTSNDYIPDRFLVVCGGLDDSTKRGVYLCLNKSDLSNPASWEKQGISQSDLDKISDFQNHINNINNPHSTTKAQVGLDNVKNIDTTNPANITQSATYRFVSDSEKSTWNGKESNNNKNIPNGYAGLDSSGLLPGSLIPSYLDQYGLKTAVVLSGTNTYTGTQTPAVTSYTNGMRLKILPTNTNTGASTLDLGNGLGAKPILKSGGPLQQNDMPAGQWQDITYSTTDGGWQLTTAIYNKLNTSANASLAGTGTTIPTLTAAGVFLRENNLQWDSTTRTITVGGPSTQGNISVQGNTFLLKVLETISSGNAFIEFNSNQTNAFGFRGADGRIYLTIKTTLGSESIVLNQKQIIDLTTGSPLTISQVTITTPAAAGNTKYYFADNLGSTFSIPFSTNQNIIKIYGHVKAQDDSASTVLSGIFKATLKRTANTISVIHTSTDREADSGTYNFVVSAESTDNTTIKLYVQPTTNAASTVALTWFIGELKYF